nr:GIY-YIG nuclease family protein [Pseudoclavibacter helvolus]
MERLGTIISLRVSPQFHALRLEELELANRHLRAVQSEKEAERAHKEELREQRKAEKELQAEKARLEKERSHYANTIAALEAKGDSDGADRMRARLNDVEHAIENVDYRAANIRAGYVYVISNVGSFGPEVVKIGLTRRLEPMDRVHELGDASVPFRFDVHALFFADDAVSIEAQLHKHFAERRINKVNFRREYFRATPTEVRDALKEQRVELLDSRLDPQAEEFNATRALESRP